MPMRPKAIAIRTIPRQLKFGSLLRLLSREEFRSGCAIEVSAGLWPRQKIYMSRVSIAMESEQESRLWILSTNKSNAAFDWDGRRIGFPECAQHAFCCSGG